MIGGIRLKVCGLTHPADVAAAAASGADCLGFIVHPDSPRHVAPERLRELTAVAREWKSVAVSVAPSPEDLRRLAGLGADFLQVHFPIEMPFAVLQAWSQAAGPGRLWLAPRLPPGLDLPPGWLALADTFLLDTYDPAKFGGTGRTGDWDKFRRHAARHPEKTWILSGGLEPGNVGAALEQGARFLDVNSGVESAPGRKDPAKLAALAAAIRSHPRPAAGGA
ncbi:MAG TPA: phosphoribosylanthranilate isomerase [Opitutaceae bacterium]|nr:phosphoribosylanthranilate isomerase [Opitutaceae bacterium]